MTSTRNELVDVGRVIAGAKALRQEVQSIGVLLGVLMTRLTKTILPEKYSDVVIQLRWVEGSLIFSLLIVPVDEMGQFEQAGEIPVARGDFAQKTIDFRRSFSVERVPDEVIRRKVGPLVTPFLCEVFKELGWKCEYCGE